MRFIAAPQKVSDSQVAKERGYRTIESTNSNAGGLTEMYGKNGQDIDLLEKVLGPRYEVQRKGGEGPHSLEGPTFVRFGEVNGEAYETLHKLSGDIPDDTGFGNDRYLRVVTWKHRRKVYAFAWTHLKAVIQNLDTGEFLNNRRWHATKDDVEKIGAVLEGLVNDRTITGGVVFGGDLNCMPKGEGLTDPHSPYVVLDRLGFDYVNERVVVLAWTKRDLRKSPLNPTKVIPPNTPANPADHAWLVLNLWRRWFKKGK